jgi:SAM-dependent methyltransferase
MITVPRAAETARDRVSLLARLYGEQAAAGDTEYLQSHGRPGAIAHHVNVFEWYAPLVAAEPDGGRPTVLDWGCNHGPDSCLLRHRFGDRIDLHACDFAPESDYRAFRAYAGARYARLTDPLKLPYENGTFDAVVGSGVLEHTAMDGEALKEVYRVLRYGGVFVVSYLPHAYSWHEWHRRNVAKADYHKRLYTRGQFARMLLSHGFEPLDVRYQGYVPHRLGGGRRPLWWKVLRPVLHPIVEALWAPVIRPLRYPFFSQSVLCGVARKVIGM